MGRQGDRREPRRPAASSRSEVAGDRLMTVAEVADLMRVSNMTVYRLIKTAQLSALRVGKNYRIREADIERYLADRSVHPSGGTGAPPEGGA